MDKWIGVNEGLPPRKEYLLVCSDRGNLYIAYYDEELKGWFTQFCTRIHVTHWMRLPKKPEEKAEGAEWVVCGDGEDVPYMCSNCGKTISRKFKKMYGGKYCPNCGKKMVG